MMRCCSSLSVLFAMWKGHPTSGVPSGAVRPGRSPSPVSSPSQQLSKSQKAKRSWSNLTFQARQTRTAAQAGRSSILSDGDGGLHYGARDLGNFRCRGRASTRRVSLSVRVGLQPRNGRLISRLARRAKASMGTVYTSPLFLGRF